MMLPIKMVQAVRLMMVVFILCIGRVHGEQYTVFVCEHKETYTMNCPSTQYINIISAKYGRMERDRCDKRDVPKNGCEKTDSLQKLNNHIKSSCGVKPSTCAVRAANSIFGDPCVNVVKYLELKFECKKRTEIRFINSPSVAGNYSLDNQTKITGCKFFNNHLLITNLLTAWIKDGEVITPLTSPMAIDSNNYQMADLSLEQVSLSDEGSYQCAVLVGGNINLLSQQVELLFIDVIRVKFEISFQSQLPTLSSERRRRQNEDNNKTSSGMFEKIVANLNATIFERDSNVHKRFVQSSNVTVYISEQKSNGRTTIVLFNQFKFLLTVKSIAGYAVSVKNEDFCDNEIIGSASFKGSYDFPVSPVGTVIKQRCTYNSTANAESDEFSRTCQSGVWSQEDLSGCLPKSKTTKDLIDLQANICTEQLTGSNCKKLVETSHNLVSIVQSSASVFIPEDISIISNIINTLAQNIETATNGSDEILKDVVKVTSVIANTKPTIISESDKKNQNTLSNIKTGLETIASHASDFLKVDSTLEVSSENVGFAAAKTAPKDLIIRSVDTGGRLKTSISTTTSGGNSNNADGGKAVMKIPRSAFNNKNNIAIFSFSFRQDTLFRNDESKTTGSNILSASVVNQKLKNLASPINITFKVGSTVGNQIPNCSFWDEVTDSWSSKGVATINTGDDDFLLCQTTHLTNFALIIDVSQTQANPLALQVITWIGCGISLGGLLLTVISYGAFRRLRRRLVPRLILCLSLSLIATLVIFLVGVEAATSSSRTSCQVIAGLIHYFLLVSFCWMAAQGINLYRSLVRVLKKKISDSQYILRSIAASLGVPALIVIITASSASQNYGDENFCLVNGLPFYLSLVMPVCIILVFNTVLLVLVLQGIQDTPSNIRSSKIIDEKAETAYNLKLAKITLLCSVLLGLTWVFGFLAVGELTTVMQYLFCIFNSLQGFFIFIFYTLKNDEVRKEWRNALGWESFLSSISQTTTNKSTSTTVIRTTKRKTTQSKESTSSADDMINKSRSGSNEPRYAVPETLKENEYCTVAEMQNVVRRDPAPYRSQALTRESKVPVHFN